jgi:hypothetical protein
MCLLCVNNHMFKLSLCGRFPCEFSLHVVCSSVEIIFYKLLFMLRSFFHRRNGFPPRKTKHFSYCKYHQAFKSFFFYLYYFS